MAMPLSSPDPLGMSNDNMSAQSPTKRGRHPSITPRKALTEASSNIQSREIYIKTPPKSTLNASPGKSPRRKAQSTSPWRIRLTVQAEPVDDIQRSNKSPVKRLTEQTTTFTVPLKGSDDTPPAVEKKGRGRPRKSLDGPLKRSGTPKPKPAGRRKTMPEPPKEQNIDADSVTATSPKKPRGRPRKSTESKSGSVSQEIDPHVWLGSSLFGGEATVETKSKTTRTKSKGRRQEITPMKIAVDSDVESQSSSVGIAGSTPKEWAWAPGNQHGESDPTGKKTTQPFDAPPSHMDQEMIHSIDAPSSQMHQTFLPATSCEQSNHPQQDESGWGSPTHRDIHSPSPQRDDSQDQREFDPTIPHQECDSILESEGFSMVSVSSLPSVRNDSLSPLQQYRSLYDHTPTVTSSPSIPPAPQAAENQSSPRQLEIPSDGTPKLEKVVRAGIALQGVLSPKDESQKLGSPFQESRKSSPFLAVESPAPQGEILSHKASRKSSEQQPGDLFRGFGAGTRRELKAGLRLGEELAKRQQRILQNPVVDKKEEKDEFQQTSSLNYPQLPAPDAKEAFSLRSPKSEQRVRYPLLSNNQLPSPDRSIADEEEERMSWKADTPIKQEKPASASAPLLVTDDSIGPNVSAIDHTMMARQEEWQREREAVSKQIEMANKSQVIVINSDDEDDVDQENGEEFIADSDIWQAEAQSADQSKETTSDVSGVLLPTEVLKPRRSKLPSPWRRNSQVIYSDELESTESDLFWQPDHLQARASKRRNARQGQAQDCSDIPAESLVDTSLDNAKKAQAQIQIEASKAWPVEGSLLSNDEDNDTATSAETTSYSDPTQNVDQATEPSAVVMPCEDPRGLGLSPSTEKASKNDVMEVAEKIKILKVSQTMSDELTSQVSKDPKAAIDPRLLSQKKTRPSSASDNPKRPDPIQPLRAMQPSTSWLSRLTAPIWSVFAPAASLEPAATKDDLLCSSPHEPLCQLTPWEDCHFRALGPLYYGSLLYGAHLFPFNPHSPSARYCGAYVTTKLGWSRKIRPEDCGITDAFMILLDERGFALGEAGERWIDEGMVITKCVALWVGMVKRGEIEVDRSKGERIGLRDQGDRKWTKDDIDWAGNQSEYFERKRREFDGLPSWKNKA